MTILYVFTAVTGALALAEEQELLIPVQGFKFSGNSVFSSEALATLAAEYAGRDLTFAELEEAAERVTLFYRERGFLVAQAYIPAQEIEADGIVEIAVHEGRYGDVIFRNDSRLKETVARTVLGPVAQGALIEAAPLERALLLLNEVPGVSARASLSAGSRTGSSDLTVHLSDSGRFTGMFRLDNYGHELTGRVRGSVQADVNNLRGYGDRLSLQITSSGGGLAHGFVGYSAAIDSTPLRMSVGYTSSHYEMGGAFADLGADGTVEGWNVGVSYPFHRTLPQPAVQGAIHRIDGELTHERRTLEDRIAGLSGVREVQAWRLATRGGGHVWGGPVDFSVAVTSGRLHIVDALERFLDALTAQTQGAFIKVAVEAAHQRAIGSRYSLQTTISAQWASKNLHSSEKLALGGARAVRAYGPGEASGDDGVLARVELQGPLFGPSLRWEAFVDGGVVNVHKEPWESGVNRRSLYGIGIGLGYAAHQYDLRLDYAAPVQESGLGDGRLGVGASVRW